MAQLQKPFNPKEVDPNTGMAQLPVGDHNVVIKSDNIDETRAKDGYLLRLDLEIIDGPLMGKTGHYRLNLYNASKKAVEIAERQLSTIAHAVGYTSTFDKTEALHNLPFRVKVAMQEDSEKYTEVVEVLAMKSEQPKAEPTKEATPAKEPPGSWSAPKTEPAKQASSGKPPWMK